MRLRTLTFLMGVVHTFIIGVVASAGTIQVNRENPIDGKPSHGSWVKVTAGSINKSYNQVAGGAFYWDVVGGTDVTAIDNANYVHVEDNNDEKFVVSFCIDLLESVNSTTYEVFDEIELVPKNTTGTTDGIYPMGENKAKAVTELWFEHIDEVVNPFTNVLDVVKADAFQFSLWEIIFEPYSDSPTNTTLPDPWNVSASSADKGTFFLETADANNSAQDDTVNQAITLANQWLANVSRDGSGMPAPNIAPDLFAWSRPGTEPNTTGGGQDQLVELRPSGGPLVPEPSSVVALAGLGLAFAAISYRRKRKAA